MVHTTIKGITEYEDKCDQFDVIWILSAIMKAISSIDSKINPIITLHENNSTLY